MSRVVAASLLVAAVASPTVDSPVLVSAAANTASPSTSTGLSLSTAWDSLRPFIWEQAAFYQAVSKPREGNIGAQQRKQVARYGAGACGGSLPPCSVMMCESGGNLTAQNPNSTASGKWQVLDSTWGGYGGYSRAMYAPEEVQDERAAQIWNGGTGASQWVCK